MLSVSLDYANSRIIYRFLGYILADLAGELFKSREKNCFNSWESLQVLFPRAHTRMS